MEKEQNTQTKMKKTNYTVGGEKSLEKGEDRDITERR
jgi:hypothetical protein